MSSHRGPLRRRLLHCVLRRFGAAFDIH